MKRSSEDEIIYRQQYSQTFKDRVIFQVLYEGRSLQEIVEIYELPSIHTVSNWVQHYKRRMRKGALTLPTMTEEEKQSIKGLQNRVKELEKKLGEANVLIYGLNTMIDYAEKEFEIKIRKKRGTKQSSKGNP